MASQGIIHDSSESDDALEIVEDEASDDNAPVNSSSVKSTSAVTQEAVATYSPRAGTKHPFKYKCPFCSKFYTSRSGVTSHKNSVHLRAKPYRCEICNEHFASSAQRVAHIHRMHTDQKKKEMTTGAGSGGPPKSVYLFLPQGYSPSSPKPPLSVEMARIPPPEGAQQRQTLNKQKEILLQTRLSDDSPRSISLSEGSTKPSVSVPSKHAHILSSSRPLSSESYECSQCSFHFEFPDDLIQHLANHRLLISPAVDDDADEEAETELRDPELNNKCPICNFVPLQAKDDGRLLENHILEVHFKAPLPPNLQPIVGSYSHKGRKEPSDNLPTLQCKFCFKDFEQDSHLQIHVRYHHRQELARQRLRENKAVPTDPKQVPNHSDQQSNIVSISDKCPKEVMPVSEECPNTEPSESETSPVAVLDKNENCPSPPVKEVISKSLLLPSKADKNESRATVAEDPVRTTADETWSCPNCSQVFQSKSDLAKHQQTSCKLPFACRACKCTFSKKEKLDSHMLEFHPQLVDSASMIREFRQTGLVYRCGDCGKTFILDSLLKSHRKICPKLVKPCPVCSINFTDTAELLEHISIMHNSEDTWLACPICPISLDSAELLEHIGIMHSSENKWLECNKCPFSSDSVVIFTEHYKKHIQ